TFTDPAGGFIQRTNLVLVVSRVVAPNITVKTMIDKTNKKITEHASFLNFQLPYDAKVTITIDDHVIQQDFGGTTGSVPFQDIPLPQGLNRAFVTRSMVEIPGEHKFQIIAQFPDPNVVTVVDG